MSRPTVLPEWATDTDYPSGTDDWSSQPTKVEPSSGEKGTGFIPQDEMAADKLNFILGNHADWIVYLESITGRFGDGSDGDVVLDGVNTFSWASLVSDVYTLSRDVFFNDVDISSGVTVHTNGFRFLAKGTVSGEFIIENDGHDGTGTGSASGGDSGDGGSLKGTGGAGGDGAFSSTPATAGSTVASNSLGGAGGDGATVTTGTGVGGGGGTTTPPDANAGPYRGVPTAHQGYLIGLSSGTATLSALQGGAGGGGGGEFSAVSGGGGGGGGGVAVVACQSFDLSGNSSITCRGGDGHAGGNSSAGGGGGGGGGLLFLTYIGLTLNGHTLTRDCAGGAGGGTGGAQGDAGDAGTLIEVQLGS